MTVSAAVDMFNEIMSCALPIALVFEIGNLIVSTFMRAAFGGRIEFRR